MELTYLNHLNVSALSVAFSSFACASVFNTHIGISVGDNNELEGWISGPGYQGPNQVFAFDAQTLGGFRFFDVGTNSVGGHLRTPA